jgi:hypothetical protein
VHTGVFRGARQLDEAIRRGEAQVLPRLHDPSLDQSSAATMTATLVTGS